MTTSDTPHLVWARAYRPAKFTTVVGQDPITKTLMAAAANGRMASALLFAGPKGTGKTTCARLVAKAINCANPRHGNPCDVCQACVEINRGTAYDLVELDAASNNGIDAIRDLRSKVGYGTAWMRYRVIVLDEAHRITVQAWDALLKTLEEPPSFVIFILCTTEIEKIPETVRSRCQIYQFQPIRQATIVALLRTIAVAEQVEVDDEILKQIALAAGGSMRNAVVQLEQLATAGEGRIDTDTAAIVPVRQAELAAMQFVKLLTRRQVGPLLELIARAEARGYPAVLLAREVSIGLSDMLWLRSGLVPPRGISPEQRATYAPLAKGVPLAVLAVWMRELAAVGDRREAWDSTLPLELAVINCLQEDLGGAE